MVPPDSQSLHSGQQARTPFQIERRPRAMLADVHTFIVHFPIHAFSRENSNNNSATGAHMSRRY